MEIIENDFRAELRAILKAYPYRGGLDDSMAEPNENARKRVLRRVDDLLANGIEPIPDRETGLGAWSPELQERIARAQRDCEGNA